MAQHDLPVAAAHSSLSRYAQVAYCACAGLFAVCIVFQVFFAGAAVMVSPDFWAMHRTFGQVIQLLPLAMLGIGFAGRLPRRMHWLNLLLVGLFVMQYLYLLVLPQLGIPAIRALHAANALALFWLAVYLWQRSLALVRNPMHNSAPPA